LFGGDPHPSGVEANRKTMETLIRYVLQQHMIAKASNAKRLLRLSSNEFPKLVHSVTIPSVICSAIGCVAADAVVVRACLTPDRLPSTERYQ
jgi:hypothetical protein